MSNKELLEAQKLKLKLLQKQYREMVSPKLEKFRLPSRIKIVQGGRGAGAKSWSIVSLITQKSQYSTQRNIMLREIQRSLEESVYQLVIDTIDRLKYPGWKITKEKIYKVFKSVPGMCNPGQGKGNESKFIFRGLADLRAAHNTKGLEGFNNFFVDEASVVSDDSWMLLLPTIVRVDGAELYIAYNPETELDPVTLRFWNVDRSDTLKVRVEPGKKDNPWWNEGLQELMEIDYKNWQDEAEHVWGGQPRKQGFDCVLSRVLIKQAMIRKIEPTGGLSVGCDPADFGDDKTEIYMRKGLKIIDHKEIPFMSEDKIPGKIIAETIKDMIKNDKSIPIRVDTTGIGASTRDFLRNMGLKVIPLNFNAVAMDENKYANLATEMWFTFPVNEADIPDDNDLMQELSTRRYKYDNKNRQIIESKKDFKERLKRSPDKADALLLTYYTGGSIIMSNEAREEMKKRNKRR